MGAEQVNVTKRTVETGDVSVGKRAVQETQRVTDTVRHEEARVERLVSRLTQGIQMLRKPSQEMAARGGDRPGETTTDAEEIVIAPAQTDDLLINLAQWVRSGM